MGAEAQLAELLGEFPKPGLHDVIAWLVALGTLILNDANQRNIHCLFFTENAKPWLGIPL